MDHNKTIPAFDIKKAAVIGAGTMGAGLAGLIAGAGIPVVLLDIVPPALTDEDKAKGIDPASRAFRDRFAQTGKERICDKRRGTIFAPEHADMIRVGNLDDDLALLRDCDWVMEVIIEKLEAKQALMEKIKPYIHDQAFLTTNTSGVSISAICEKLPLAMRQRFLGAHFFNPPRYMHLLELIPGVDTDPARMAFMADFGTRILGKGVVVAKDTPNFIGNRIGIHKSVQTFQIMEKYGFDPETVDYLTGPVIGRPKTATFGTTDLVGLDIAYHVAGNVKEALLQSGDPAQAEEAKLFEMPAFVQEMYREGRLGNKTGGGFFKRVDTPEGREFLRFDFEKKEYLPKQGVKIDIVEETLKLRSTRDKLEKLCYDDSEAGRFTWETTKSFLLYSAEKIPEIADDYKDIDAAMRWGYNWELGPFETWDVIGVERSVAKMKEEGDVVPAWVEERLAAGKTTFYDVDPLDKRLSNIYPTVEDFGDSALLDMGDGVLCLEIKTKGNAINEAFKAQVRHALDVVESNPIYKGLVLANGGSNFLTGADLRSFLQNAESGQYGEMVASCRDFHKTSLRLKYAKKPVIAAVGGKALGGGLEFAMHCSRIVAYVESNVGLVESGVGIIPGGGGCKEYLTRMMEKVEGLGIPDPMPIVSKVWQTILMAQVSRSAYDARAMGYLKDTDKIVMNRDELLAEAKKEALRMSEDGFHQGVAKKVPVTGTSGFAAIESMINAMHSGNMMSDYDVKVARALARAITGGDVPKGTLLTEQELLDLEAEGIAALAPSPEAKARVAHILTTGKPLRN